MTHSVRAASIALSMITFGFFALCPAAESGAKVDAETIRRALDDLKVALDERWSYRHANDADFDAAIAALRVNARGGLSVDELGIEIHKVVALGIDGHSGVTGYQLPGNRYLPFLVEPAGERFVAFTADRTAFLANGFPYVIRIDGKDVNEWCRAVGILVPKGSEQYRRHRCTGRLRNIDFVRKLMNVPKKDMVDVTLANHAGDARKTVSLQLVSSLPMYGVWPRVGSQVLDGNVGYLRLPYMAQQSSIAEIETWLPKFRGTKGLIIDVRDNDGGARDALRLIYSYLANPGDEPRVFTAAAYRLHAAHKEDHLAGGQFMYRADAKEWTTGERQAVAAFAKAFRPQWELPKGEFSRWHYMALSRLNDPSIYHYDKPVIVLMNGKCFSATDIFLAGLKGMNNVTLMGTASAGGSANTQSISLGTTPLILRIGSMASFRADGRLFDGNGVRPDVVVDPVPEYYIGTVDNLLAEAQKRLVRPK